MVFFCRTAGRSCPLVSSNTLTDALDPAGLLFYDGWRSPHVELLAHMGSLPGYGFSLTRWLVARVLWFSLTMVAGAPVFWFSHGIGLALQSHGFLSSWGWRSYWMSFFSSNGSLDPSGFLSYDGWRSDFLVSSSSLAGALLLGFSLALLARSLLVVLLNGYDWFARDLRVLFPQMARSGDMVLL